MTKSVFFPMLVLALCVHLAVPAPAEAAIFNSQSALDQSEVFALDPMFDPVGYITYTNSQGEFMAGTGVLIDPNWVLTVGHVVTSSDTTLHQEMAFSLNNDFYEVPYNMVAAEDYFTFPGYSENMSPGTGDDIALIKLVDPIFDVAPAVRYRGPELVDPVFNVAGYGKPGVWPDEGDFDGILRGGRNIADYSLPRVDDSKFWMSYFDRFDSGNPLPLEWNGSQFDSGSGWFTEVNGEMQLIGMSNAVFGLSNSTAGIRVPLYNDWIDSHVNPVPEPTA